MTFRQRRLHMINMLKEELVKVRLESKATKKDIAVVLDDYLRQDGDYTLSHQTKLYHKHSGEYCVLLEILNHYDKNNMFRNLKV